MGANETVVGLVQALAWPAAAILLAVLLRPLIKDLIKEHLTEVEAFGWRAKFGRFSRQAEVSAEEAASDVAIEATEELVEPPLQISTSPAYELAEKEPTLAIINTYEKVESALVARLRAAGLSPDLGVRGTSLARLARDFGTIDEPTLAALISMAELRNLVAHGKKQVRSVDAVQYVAAAENVLYSLASKRVSRYTVSRDGAELSENLAASAAFRLVTQTIVEEVGVEKVLAAVGPPILSRRRAEVTRPTRARHIPTTPELWHTSQLDQRDFMALIDQLRPLSAHDIVVHPAPHG